MNLEAKKSRHTQHLADVGLDVHILEVLVGDCVVEAERGVQPDGHPHAIA